LATSKPPIGHWTERTVESTSCAAGNLSWQSVIKGSRSRTVGLVEGSVHDAKLNRDRGELFPHLKFELALTDSGYQGKEHCLVPFKKRVRVELPPDERRFNRHHRVLRSRVERTFAWLDGWRIFTYCDHELKFVDDALAIILNFYCYTHAASNPYGGAQPIDMETLSRHTS
jgi:hypothetical protein